MTAADAVREVVMMLGDGNPGGLRVACDLARDRPEALIACLATDYRGPDIWVGFKDWAGEDLSKFADGLIAGDAELRAAIDRERAR